ncbi:hypothetical protein MPRS_54390 [Mycobacterium paraseoulense]|uniref:Uncharacterized protein n=1 Tax=Mycobacterium paraseoulense TaxID=590652 RepID=A0A1X0I5F1_9MYCO|nr:hypothetical protein BST39_21785 [Mycobacterium paraseoulense]BBZ74346.1 hypothetical protein MPRS_54390 [Mycobacterium paraseoulense]
MSAEATALSVLVGFRVCAHGGDTPSGTAQDAHSKAVAEPIPKKVRLPSPFIVILGGMVNLWRRGG